MVETAAQCGREVGRWPRFEAGDDPTPSSRDQRHRYLADAEMIINRVQAALRFDRKSEIPVPITLGDDIATGRANGQPKELGIRNRKTLAVGPNPGLKATDGCRPVMVAIVGQQGDPQGQSIIQRIGPRPQEPRGIGRMGAGLHPNPGFYLATADFVGPYGNGVVKMKAANPDMTGRSGVTGLPSVREQRPRMSAVYQRGIGLGKYQPTAERRCNWRDQQSVIAASQAAGNGATRVSAEPIGNPPFASLCLAEVTADRACESDRAWD